MEDESARELAGLACFPCKRRKVKCNRFLPVCSLCIKLGVACSYPAHGEKPGPKIGSTHKNKRRRLQGSDSAAVGTSRGGDTSPDTSQHAFSTRSTPGTSAIAPIPHRLVAGYQSEDASLLSVDLGALSPPSTRHAIGGEVSPKSPNAPTFSQIMYPSHEAQTRGPSPSPRERTPERRAAGNTVTTETICNGLRISEELYDYLMESYFANMTSFTVFKPRSIEQKLRSLRSAVEGEALVAAIFSFSSRFHGCFHTPGRPDVCPTSEHFAAIAATQLDKALDRYADSVPPFWLLQTYVLVAFYELTRSVRSKSWRVLGNCIRLAYEMNLHMIDVERHPESEPDGHTTDADRWSDMEERRRAWWAIWEMDLFASTIRRLPMAIDWGQNFTYLPVPDECWFNSIPQPSCYLALDPALRWKHLSNSGNNSARAWFIVINSLMRNAQLIAYPMGSTVDWSGESNDDDLHIIENSLFCASNSLPPDLTYHGETLDFRTKASSADISCRQYHSDKFAIHLMTQLVRFMSHHHKVCAQAPAPGTEPSAPAAALSSSDASSWSHYMNAAQEIVTITRNSAPDHCKYVNPFLTNTVWFAAAAQVACRVFGPTSRNKQLVESNYELLVLVIDRFIAFWDIMGMLKRRLTRVEAGLKGLTAGPYGGGGGSRDANAAAGMRAGGSTRPGAVEASQSLQAGGSVVDPDSLQFMPMLYENFDGSPLGDLPFFPDPGHFFPYGLGDLWMWNKATPN